MSGWFRPTKKKEAEKKTEVGSEVSPIHRSLAFNALFHQFRGERKYTILDLGPPVGANVDFFSQFTCRLHIEDLYDTLTSFDYFSPEDGFSYDAVFSYLFPYDRNYRFDFILAWDLFNYLDREVLKHLAGHLGKFSRKGTMLFGLVSANRHIPETPHRFRIVDSERLLYQVSSSVLRDCPRYEPSDLAQLMPHFRVFQSFVLRNGYREYIFLYE
jgi:hypothetical protein